MARRFFNRTRIVRTTSRCRVDKENANIYELVKSARVSYCQCWEGKREKDGTRGRVPSLRNFVVYSSVRTRIMVRTETELTRPLTPATRFVLDFKTRPMGRCSPTNPFCLRPLLFLGPSISFLRLAYHEHMLPTAASISYATQHL